MINIGLCSPSMQMGKSTTAKYLIQKYQYKTVTLAKPIKDMVEVFLKALGYTDEEIEDMIYGSKKEASIEKLPPLPDGKPVTPRHLMQTLGTEWGRTHVGQNIWIDISTANLDTEQAYVTEDIRFINEADAFRKAGFKIVKINNPRVPIIRGHASEGELDNYDFDYVIENDGTIEDLHNKINGLLY